MWGWDDHMGGMGGGWWLVMSAIWIATIALVVFAVVRLFSGNVPPGGSSSSDRNESPLEILDRRLASGEIGIDEYRQIKATLGGGDAQE